MAKGKCVDWENKKNVVTMCDLCVEERTEFCRVPLEIPRKFLTMLLTFGLLDQFLTAVLKCLKTNVTNKLEIYINRVINSREVKNC
jgi:hypothetical protein